MTATSSLTNINIGQFIIDSINEGMAWAAHIIWDSFTAWVLEYWIYILIAYLLLLFVSLLLLSGGKWGMFGSLSYHTLYFGILFIVGLIKGPEVFISDYFEVFCAIVLYPLCYFLTGLILNKVKHKLYGSR